MMGRTAGAVRMLWLRALDRQSRNADRNHGCIRAGGGSAEAI
jgi:hypothetical protein